MERLGILIQYCLHGQLATSFREYLKNMILKSIALFSELTDSQIEALMRIAKKKAFGKNVIIAQEGETLETFNVILSGSVKVFQSEPNGKELTIDVLKPGNYFGEIPFR